jgi:hypothetical protein
LLALLLFPLLTLLELSLLLLAVSLEPATPWLTGVPLVRIRVLLAADHPIALQAVTLLVLLLRLGGTDEPREELRGTEPELLHE